MRSALFALALAAALAPAQEKPAAAKEAPKEPRAQKIVQLKYADPGAMKQLMEVFGCCANANPTFKTLSLSYPADIMPAVEDAIRRFDVPAAAPKNIELAAYFLIASEDPAATGTPVPPELDAVVKQLRSVFAYKGFAVLDSQLMRMGSGQGGDLSGVAPISGAPRPAVTQLGIQRWSLAAGDKGDVVTLERLRASVQVPVAFGPSNWNNMNIGVSAERIDIPTGQKVVVGKSNMGGPGKALVLVLSARVL